MAGVVGTLGMLAEASGCGAVSTSRRAEASDASMGDWLTCFPGFAMLTTGPQELRAGPAVSAVCGELTTGQGVELRWPDGEVTEACGRRDRDGSSMTTLRMAAVAANFDRDLEADFARVAALIAQARAAGVQLAGSARRRSRRLPR